MRTAIHAVKPDRVATFLGHTLTAATTMDLGSDFTTRVEGTCIKHDFGPASTKLYNTFGRVLRIETTANDVTFFKHHRQVEQQDGTTTFTLAPMSKTIDSLHPDLRQLLLAADLRYLAFLSDPDDPSAGLKALDKVTRSVEDHGRGYKGFNFFAAIDQQLFEMPRRPGRPHTQRTRRSNSDAVPQARVIATIFSKTSKTSSVRD